MKILMVCLGNICRSPLAQGILEHKAKLHNLNIEVDSAGTSGYHNGEPPHHLSIKIAKQFGVDISKQVSRKFIVDDINNFDKIFVMDEENYKEVKKICWNKFDENKVNLLLNLVDAFKDKNVPDPWYGAEDGYIEVYKMIDKACEKLIDEMLKK